MVLLLGECSWFTPALPLIAASPATMPGVVGGFQRHRRYKGRADNYRSSQNQFRPRARSGRTVGVPEATIKSKFRCVESPRAWPAMRGGVTGMARSYDASHGYR